MTGEGNTGQHLPTPFWVTFESGPGPNPMAGAERIHFTVVVLYPEEVKVQLGSLKAAHARAVALARETIGERLCAAPELDALVCTVNQAEPGPLPMRGPHRLLADGTKVWLAAVGRS